MQQTTAKRTFIAVWATALVVRCALALHLPLFVDEAFYWQESRHPAWAYSDLPGFTAWLVRVGEMVAGHSPIGVRWPFLLMSALLPWWIAAIARRESGDAAQGWLAGVLACLLPLLGTLGILALPDVPLALATVLCLDAGTRLLRGVDARGVAMLASGLVVGGLTHYRFAAVIGVGFLVLLLLPEGRRALRDARVWAAVAAGALAWWPLIHWNLQNADAGLRFQLVDRHPWAFHADGAMFVLVQAVFATPLLMLAMLRGGLQQRGPAQPAGRRYLAWSGLLVLAGFFALGFFADSDRVSFHWPLPAWIALLPLVPQALSTWSPRWRRALLGMAAIALLSCLGYYVAVSVPAWRGRAADSKWYPWNFAGWDTLADAVRARRSTLPPGTRIVADNFKLGSELGFALDDPAIAVLDHPLNRQHGRAPQLALWGLTLRGRADLHGAPALLVIGATDVQYRDLLTRYHALCEAFGPLPPPQVLNIDHGVQRFLLFALPARAPTTPCVTPALAWIDAPAPGAAVTSRVELRGWAFKDGVGIARIEALLDGRPAGELVYGQPRPEVAAYWRRERAGGSTDPQQPDVGFDAVIPLQGVAPGVHRLGLRIHGRDGSVEDWPSQPLVVR